MVLIGLTGGIGSGKSTVCQFFAAHGIAIIDTDIIARELVKTNMPAFKQIKQHFGASVVNPDNELNRGALRQKIFEDPAEKAWLENLLHPLIHVEAHQQALAARSPYSIVVIPLLFETENYPWLNRILVVETSIETQIQRAVQRDASNSRSIEKIIQSQVSPEIRRQGADDIIQNNGTLGDLKKQVDELHQFYLHLSQIQDPSLFNE